MARYVGDLEETCLEKDYSAIFGEKCIGVLEKTFGDFWREPFGDFGELYSAKSWSAIWRNRSAILEKTVR